MSRFIRKPIEVQAYRWQGTATDTLPGYLVRWENAVDEDMIHARCGAAWHNHAVTMDAKHQIVCPGDWAVRETKKDIRVLNDTDFRQGYEPATEHAASRITHDTQTSHDMQTTPGTRVAREAEVAA